MPGHSSLLVFDRSKLRCFLASLTFLCFTPCCFLSKAFSRLPLQGVNALWFFITVAALGSVFDGGC